MSVTSLQKTLPTPRYTGTEEELRDAQGRVVDTQKYETQIQLAKHSGPPAYPRPSGWRPRTAQDFGDGGAYPEVPIAQFPLDLGRASSSASGKALARKVDQSGNTDYSQIARRGQGDKIVQTSFGALIPLRNRLDESELALHRPSAEEIEETREKTAAALGALISGQTAAQNPKQIRMRKDEPTFVKYTPSASMMGESTQNRTRVLKIQQRQLDPMEPPKHRFKRIPGRAPSPPPPVLHSPPRKLTAEDQEMWRIPPSISNWKNPKGYTVPLDKRLASDGRNLQDVTINDKFASFAEALSTADQHAREEVKQRAMLQQKLAEKEKLQREEHLRELAQKAREERTNRARRRSSSSGDSEEEEAQRQREEARRERRQEHQRELRQSRMGTERKLQMMAREQNRDISEKVALGLAKPTQSGEAMYDSRLFNRSSGFDAGFNEDQAYDKPLFAAQDAISSIYRPSVQQEDDVNGDETYANLTKSSKFEVLGRAKEGFKGAEFAEAREGPVQFEKDTDDPFQIEQMINEVKEGKAGEKRYGIQEPEGREKKRARVDDDSD